VKAKELRRRLSLGEGQSLEFKATADLEAVGRAVTRADLAGREPTLWRYRELLPVEDANAIVSLGEGMTPLIECPRLARELGVARLTIKDESQLPTGAFKSRGMTMAVSMAKQLGVERVEIAQRIPVRPGGVRCVEQV